jgi:hypothetical protein
MVPQYCLSIIESLGSFDRIGKISPVEGREGGIYTAERAERAESSLRIAVMISFADWLFGWPA